MTATHVHKWERYVKTDEHKGVRCIHVGCFCGATMRFPEQGKLAIVDNRILEVLQKAGEPLATDEIRERARCSKGYMSRVLARFLEDKRIERVSRGIYRLAPVSNGR